MPNGHNESLSVDAIAQKLGGEKRTSRGWLCLCPAHDDSKPSLSIDLGENGKPLFACRAGCAQEEILNVLRSRGLWAAPAEGFTVPAGMRRELGEPVAFWDYYDPAGRVVGRVVRFQPPGKPKEFRQCRPNGVGWKWKMDGLKLPLYRLPELIAAPPGSTVFLPEGEKHADRLAAWGLLATTNAGGAGKFREDHAAALAGHRVVILQDNDEAGARHTVTVRPLLAAAGIASCVLLLPDLQPKGDVLDWIAAGGTREALERLAEAAWRLNGPAAATLIPEALGAGAWGKAAKPANDIEALPVLRPSEISDEQARPYVVKGLIARRDLVISMGQPGSGKSVIAPHIAYAVAQRMMVFGRRVRGGPVIYLASEDGHGMKNRVRALLKRYGDAPDFHLVPVSVDLMNDGPQRRALDALIARVRPVLIVVDTLGKSFPGLRENDSDDMGRVVRTGRQLTEVCDSAVWLIHHVAKDAGSTPRGHGSLAGDADLTMLIEGAGADTRTIRLGKNRNGPSDMSFAFRVEVDELGMDEDGDPITAPVALELDEAPTSASRRESKLPAAAGLLLKLLRNQHPDAFETCRPHPDMPTVQAISRASLRAALVSDGWFPEPLLSVLSSAFQDPESSGKPTRAGLTYESNALKCLKNKGLLNYDRDLAWLT